MSTPVLGSKPRMWARETSVLPWATPPSFPSPLWDRSQTVTPLSLRVWTEIWNYRSTSQARLERPFNHQIHRLHRSVPDCKQSENNEPKGVGEEPKQSCATLAKRLCSQPLLLPEFVLSNFLFKSGIWKGNAGVNWGEQRVVEHEEAAQGLTALALLSSKCHLAFRSPHPHLRAHNCL